MREALAMFLPVLLVSIVGCATRCCAESGLVTVFAAAAARPAIEEMCQKVEVKYGIKVEVSYGGGGEVLSQMILAKRGDVYLAPEQRFMKMAKEKGAIKPETVRILAYMIPVIVVRKGNAKRVRGLADLARPGVRVAVTRPETTLLGKYAPEIFHKSGLGGAIEKNIVTKAPHPAGLLTMLIMGHVDAGIIWHFYRTLAPDKIETILLSPEQLTGIGEMQVAISTYSDDSRSAQRFIDFATSNEGKEIFKRHGYIVDGESYWH